MKKRDDIYLLEILQRIRRISSYLNGLKEEGFLESELHQSGVIRELEVIGEAARFISESVKSKFSGVPWAQIVGMRNRLVHQYFDVDYRIVWEVAREELPKLEAEIGQAILDTAPQIHPWRACPLGFYHVGPFKRTKPSGGKVPVSEQCRRNPSGKDHLYPPEIRWITENHIDEFKGPNGLPGLKEFTHGQDFDALILLWVRYWNDVLPGPDPLDPVIIKALMGSESSFHKQVKVVKVTKRNFARGLMQVTDETRATLRDEAGEIKDHYLTISKEEVLIPSVAVAAAIRWLFHKRELAGVHLRRAATWVEAIADYKGVLRKKVDYRKQHSLKTFFRLLGEMGWKEK